MTEVHINPQEEKSSTSGSFVAGQWSLIDDGIFLLQETGTYTKTDDGFVEDLQNRMAIHIDAALPHYIVRRSSKEALREEVLKIGKEKLELTNDILHFLNNREKYKLALAMSTAF